MAKRKRGNHEDGASPLPGVNGSPVKVAKTNGHPDPKAPSNSPVIQIIAGSYERVLHGITASISDLSTTPSVQFADSFLFNAHDSAIRCLALSPLPDPTSTSSPDSQNVFLATGGSDEKVNVYSLAASPLEETSALPPMPTLGNTKVSENPRNRELGTILEHSSNITALHFPTRSKLLSASEDNTIAITRTKDLTVVSTIKAPRPKAVGQPSGDTAPQGTTPSGVNDFAVHPSLKLMVTVGKGERCMRLWNLVTGKKAGVLNFGRDVLQSVKEGKYSSGEGRKICWNTAGTEFAVAFERGVVVFGEDSRPKCRVVPSPLTKVHHVCFISVQHEEEGQEKDILALSAEDGRIVFYDTTTEHESTATNGTDADESSDIPSAKALAQLGGKAAGISGRVKDFEVLTLLSSLSAPSSPSPPQDSAALVVTANSDGAIRLWHLLLHDLTKQQHKKDREGKEPQIGQLIGTYETGNRITCLKAFVMLPAVAEDAGLSEFEGLSENDGEETSSSSESEDED